MYVILKFIYKIKMRASIDKRADAPILLTILQYFFIMNNMDTYDQNVLLSRMNRFISQTMYQAVKGAAKNFPEHIAYRYFGKETPYRTFIEKIDHIADCFASYGIKKGDVVVFCMPNTPTIIDAVYALNKIGAVVCIIHPMSAPAEISYYLKDTSAKLIICYKDLLPMAEAGRKTSGRDLPIISVSGEETFIPSYEGLISQSDEKGREEGDIPWSAFCSQKITARAAATEDYSSLALILYSGGTTGQPKGIMLSSYNLNAIAFQTEQGSGLIPMSDYSMLAVIPLFHGFGFGVNVHLMLSTGGTTILIPRFSATELGATVIKEKPNIIAGVPTLFYGLIMAADTEGQDLSFLKGAFAGGDSVPQNLKAAFKKFMSAHNSDIYLREGYGLTESVTVNCISDWDGGREGSMGRPLIGNRFFACEPGTDTPLPPGERGELCMTGPTVMLGYLNKPDITKETLRVVNGQTVLHTGDYGYVDEDGYVYYVSRIKRIIITNGYNVYPSEIEGVAIKHPDVDQACCLGVSDPVRGQSVVLAIIPKPSADTETLEKDLRAYLKEKLSEYKMPGKILFRKEFPKTRVGKISYGEIIKSITEEEKRAFAPEEAFEKALQETIGVAEIDNVNDFISAGGDSHKIFVFLMTLRELGYMVTLADLTKAKTKEDIIRAMKPVEEEEKEERYADSDTEKELAKENVLFEKIYPVTPIQEGILYHSLTAEKEVYNVIVVLRPLKKLDVDIFKKASELLFEKYEAYRTGFYIWKKGSYAVVRSDVNFHAESVQSDAPLSTFVTDLSHRGFDIQKDCLFRMFHLQTTDGEYIVFNVHHAISDGISDFNAISYFIDSYMRLLKGEEFLILKKEAKEYRLKGFDYGAYLKKTLTKDSEEAKDFFRKEFAGYEGGSIYLKGSGCSGRRMLRRSLSSDLDGRIREFCSENGFNVNIFSKAVWAILLQRYTYCEDVVFGDVVSGRESDIKGIDEAVGLFLNTVPMRFDVRAERTVRELLTEIKEKTIAYLPYRFLPTAESIKCAGRLDLQSIYNYEDDDGLSYGVGADMFERKDVYDNSNYPLEFEITGKGVVTFNLRYDLSKYRPEDMEVLAKRIQKTYEEILDHVDEQIGKINLLTSDDVCFLSEHNDTTLPFDEKETVIKRLEKQAALTPDRRAITFYDRELTYRELDERSDGIAAFLVEKGVKKGDVVALYVRRSPEMITAIYGILKTGALYLPLDETYPKERCAFVLTDSGAKAVLSDGLIPETSLPVLTGWENLTAPKRSENISGEDGAYIIYTSGTTGQPKGVVSTHKGLSNLLLSYERIYDLTERDVVLQVASYTFDQSVWDIFGILSKGGTLAVITNDDVHDPERIEWYCNKKEVTIASFTPAMIAELDPDKFPSLRILDSSGEAANALVLQKWVGKTRVINTYGPTEYTVNACSYEYVGLESENIPIGDPINNTQFYVLSKGDAINGPGMPGELCIAGCGLSTGYLHRKELTDKKFVSLFGEKMYRTGDLAYWTDEGILFIDRIDSQVKIRGFRIELMEIDAHIRRIDGVKDCFVCVEKIARDKTILAYVVGSTEKDVAEKLRRTLPGYMVPQYVIPIDRIPRSVSGKVDRAALPKPQKKALMTLPLTEKQKVVADVWKKVLQIEEVYCEDDFFETGGDSIKAIRLSTGLDAVGLFVSVKEVMSARTLKKIAEVATTVQSPEESKRYALVSEEDIAIANYKFGEENIEDIYPTAPLQEGILYHALCDKNKLEYLAQLVIELPDRFDDLLLEQSFRLLFEKYPVLRTSFIWTEKGGMQVILKHRPIEFIRARGDVDEICDKDIERGFDLEKDALMRILYIEAPDKKYMAQTCHHLILDGWSEALLLRQLQAMYRRLVGGESYEQILASIKTETVPSYKFFVERIVRKDSAAAEKHYKSLMENFDGGYDYPSKKVGKYLQDKACEKRFRIATDMIGLAKRYATTESVLYQTAWGIVLGITNRTGDIVFGNVISGRAERIPEIEKIAGMCINTVPVRVRFKDDTTVEEVINEIAKQHSDNAEYGFLPLATTAPHIGTITVMEYFDQEYEAVIYRFINQTSYDMELNYKTRTGECVFRYNGSRYDEKEIDKLIGYFIAVTSALTIPSTAVKDCLPLTPEEENVFNAIRNRIVNKKKKKELTFEPLQTEKERTVAECIGELLSLDVQSRNDDFFALGGDSIKVIRLVSVLRKKGFVIDVKQIMTLRTVARIAGALKKAKDISELKADKIGSGVTPADCLYAQTKYGRENVESIFRLTPLQEGMLYHVLRDVNNPEYDTQIVIEVHHVDLQIIKRVLELLADNYEVLRSNFIWTENGARQVILKNRRPELSVHKGDIFEIADWDLKKGFDIEQDPLFRVLYVEDGDKKYLIQNAHHLILDGWSNGIIFEKFNALYRKIKKALPVDGLLPKERAFRDYVEYLHKKDRSEAERYYSELLRDFHGGYEYPSEGEKRPLERAVEYTADIPVNIADLAKELSVTEPILLQTAWGIVLGVTNGTNDALFGNVISGRDAGIKGIEDMVGMFINTVPVRVRFDQKTTFLEVIKEVERQNVENVEYGYLPISTYGKEIGTVTVFNNFGQNFNFVQKVRVTDQTGYDLELERNETGSHYILRYNAARYKKEEIERLTKLIGEILKIIAENADISVGNANLLSDEEIAHFHRISRSDVAICEQAEEPINTQKEKLIASAVEELLSVEVRSANDDFFALGGDSIKAIRLSAKMREKGYKLTVKDISDARTIAKMAAASESSKEITVSACGAIPQTPVIRDFFKREYPNPDGYLQEVLFCVPGEEKEYRKAVRMLYEHHDILRAEYRKDGLFVPPVGESKPLVFITEKTDDVLKKCAEIRKKISLTGTLFIAAYIRGEKNYLYLCAHHLIIDGVSWRIIAEDLYTAVTFGKLPPKTTSYLAWAKKCESGVKVSEKEENYWANVERSILPIFPKEKYAPVRIKLTIDKETTKRIVKNGGRKYDVRPDLPMATALVRSIGKLYKTDEVPVLMESYGRQNLFDNVDLSRTVGWFTSYYPVIFSIAGLPQECLLENKERLMSVPDDGIRYQFLTGGNSAPEVIINYMGTYDGEVKGAELCRLPEIEDNPEREKLDLEGEIVNGELNLSFRFNGVSEEDAKKVVELWKEEFDSLAELFDEGKKVYSPADVGYPGMNKEDFAEVLIRHPIRIAPLTPTQQGMIYHSESDGQKYLEQTILRLPFAPEKQRTKEVIRAIMQKHAVFRTEYIRCASGNIYQYVVEKSSVVVSETEDWEERASERIAEGISPFDGVPIRIDIDKDVLVISSHHIAWDAWSERIFIDEFEKLYKEEKYPKQKETASFCEYASGYGYRQTRLDYSYWVNLVSGAKDTFVPSHGKGENGEVKRISRYVDLSYKITKFSRENGITENTFFEAATARFLQIVCRAQDVLFGKVVSGRDDKTTSAIGMYISTLPVRVSVSGPQEILREVYRQGMESERHESCPLSEIFSRAKLTDPMGVLFVYDSMEGVDKIDLIRVRDSTNYGLTIAVTKEEGFVVDISFNDEYLSEEIESLLSLYLDCCRELIGIPRQIISEVTGNKKVYPDTLTSLWKDNKPFKLIADKECKKVREKAESLSAYLSKRSKGGVIGVQCERGVNMIIALYAVVISGNAYMPIPVDGPDERMEFMRKDANVKIVLDDEFMNSFVYDNESYIADVSGEDICYVIYTSGSTGKPKGVKVSHAAIANRLCWMEDKYPLEGGVILQKTPYTFDVSVWEIFRPVLFGGTLVLIPPKMHADPMTIANYVEKYKVTQLHFVPSVYDLYLEQVKGKEVFAVKDVFLSGEKLSAKTVKRHYEVYKEGSSLHNLYGPTECAVDVTYYDCDGTENDVPIGAPIDNVTVSLQWNGYALPCYVEGEIVAGGRGVGAGYVGEEQGGFVGGTYYTGDIGWQDERGNIHFVGRKDRQIKLHGLRIEPGEIEWIIGNTPGVRDAVVEYVSDEKKGGYLCTFVVADRSVEKDIRARLPENMTPSKILFVDAIPLTENGKRDLTALLEEGTVQNDVLLQPAEKQLLDAVCQVAPSVGFDTPLIEAGVSSFDRIRIATKVAPFGYTYNDVIRVDTVRELYEKGRKEYFFRYTSGNKNALVCIPYAGATGRIFSSVSIPGCDVYAAIRCAFEGEDWEKAKEEWKAIVRRYEKVYVYAHCLGTMTALKLMTVAEVTGAFFGAHVPDAISSIFGRPIDVWKKASDKKIVTGLQKAGLMTDDGSFASLFRADASIASRIEAQKPTVDAPVTVVLAKNDPLTKIDKADIRWKKFLRGTVNIVVLPDKNHYFIEEADFSEILSELMRNK